jgi:hypothetical protein
MKIIMTILTVTIFSAVGFASIPANSSSGSAVGACQVEAEGLLKTGGAYTQPAQLVSSGSKFEIYQIRSVLHGGDALDELVVLKQGCKWVAQENVWSE